MASSIQLVPWLVFLRRAVTKLKCKIAKYIIILKNKIFIENIFLIKNGTVFSVFSFLTDRTQLPMNREITYTDMK